MPQIIVNGTAMDWEEGMTVRRLLQIKRYSFGMLVIRINGTLVKKADYDSTPVPPGADVMVYHLMSGG
jgi:thiamine biosynthesis protein ThiS